MWTVCKGIELAGRRGVIWLGTGRNQYSTARHLKVDLNPAWMCIFGGFSLIQSGGANTLPVPSTWLTTALSWFRLLGRNPAGESRAARKVAAAWCSPADYIKCSICRHVSPRATPQTNCTALHLCIWQIALPYILSCFDEWFYSIEILILLGEAHSNSSTLMEVVAWREMVNAATAAATTTAVCSDGWGKKT